MTVHDQLISHLDDKETNLTGQLEDISVPSLWEMVYDEDGNQLFDSNGNPWVLKGTRTFN